MGQSGMQRCAVFVAVLSLSMLVLLNQHSAAFDWTTSSSSSASLSMDAVSNSYGMEGLHQGNMVVGEETKRRRLQQLPPVPAPAPGPSAAGSGQYIGYGALIPDYSPCPPQTGRPYYTQSCDSASGPVNPYTRGCSTISLCARG